MMRWPGPHHPASPDPDLRSLVGPLALITGTGFGPGGSAGQEGQLNSPRCQFRQRLCLELDSHQILDVRIATALLDSPWAYRKPRFETRATSWSTHGGAPLCPALPLPPGKSASPPTWPLGHFVSVHPAGSSGFGNVVFLRRFSCSKVWGETPTKTCQGLALEWKAQG